MKNILYHESIIVEIKSLFHIMKITVLALFIFAGTAFATESYSQAMKVTVMADNIPMAKVINEIEKQTDYLFVYDVNEVNLKQNVKLNAQNKSVADVLNIMFKGTNIHYAMKGTNIMLMKGINNEISLQQIHKITGIVKDENGEPIIGANVSVKNQKTIGAITDMNGRFTIDVPVNVVLQVTYIGYIPQEINIGNKKNVNIFLKEDNKTLDEVVVVGYGVQKKVNVIGAVETVKADQIADKPVTSIVSTLTGEAAGVTIKQSSGQPGANQGSVRIRGIGTWGDASPLVLVDGISMSLDDVIPSEVESVSILKDASSAAIYGSRAANGVILITTKKGKAGKVSFSYSGNMALQRATRVPEMASSWQYAEMYNQMMVNEGQSPIFSEEKIKRLKNGTGNPDLGEANTDWYKELLRIAPQHNHQISIQGGGERFTYMIATGYSDQKGVIPSTAFNRYNLRINTTSQLTSWLKLDLNMTYLNSLRKEAARGGATDAYRRAGRALPYLPVKFSDGTWSYNTYPTNPVRRVSGDYGSVKNYNDAVSVLVAPEIKILDGLIVKGNFAYESNTYRDKSFEKTVVYDSFEQAGQAATTEENRNKQIDKWSQYRNITANALISYEKTIGKHSLSAMVGTSLETFKYAFTEASRMDFPNNDFSEINAGDPTTASANGNSTYAALASAFGRIGYNFKEKYLVEFTARYDGSSKFAKGNRWGFFPSASLGWRISEETFFQPLTAYVSNLKFRVSYGLLGNQKISNYQYYSLIGNGGNYMYDDKIQMGYAESKMGNELITWESSKNFNVGIDFGLFDNKLSGTFDWYKKRTSDILLQLKTPDLLGIDAPIENAGIIENQGWDLTLNWQSRIGKDFKYKIGMILSDVKNKVIDLKGYKSPTSDLTARIEGQPLDAIFGYKTLGICENQADYDKYQKQMKTFNPKWGIGDIIIEDLYEDGKIDANDKTVIGNSIPRYTFGINLGFDYKNWDFSCFFQGVGKADGYITYEAIQGLNGGGVNSPRKEHYEKTFNPSNPQPGAYFPRTLKSTYNFDNMSHWIQNASYVRLKNLQIGYTFNVKGFNKFRVYLSGENLFTITKFMTWDPETPVGSRTSYPHISIYSVGVNLIF